MAVQYIHLDYESYKSLEQQIRQHKETSHQTEGGFYHKSIRLRLGPDNVIEFHGPLVGGYGHTARRRGGKRRTSKRRTSKRRAMRRVRKVAAKKR